MFETIHLHLTKSPKEDPMKRYGYVAAALLAAAFIALSACSAPELDFPPSVSISEPTD